MSDIAARDRLIVALDMPRLEEARELVARLGGGVTFYKIGLELVMTGGLELGFDIGGAIALVVGLFLVYNVLSVSVAERVISATCASQNRAGSSACSASSAARRAMSLPVTGRWRNT